MSSKAESGGRGRFVGSDGRDDDVVEYVALFRQRTNNVAPVLVGMGRVLSESRLPASHDAVAQNYSSLSRRSEAWYN